MPNPESLLGTPGALMWRLHKGPDVATCYQGLETGTCGVRVQIARPDVLVTIVEPTLAERDEIAAADNWRAALLNHGWLPIAAAWTVRAKADRPAADGGG